MKIRTAKNSMAIRWTWRAWDEDLTGCGTTEREAIQDLMRRMRELKDMQQDEDKGAIK